MCFLEKCCFIVPLDLACLILGFSSFILSSFLALSCIILLCVERESPGRGVYYLENYPQIHLNGTSINIILYSVTLVALLWMTFSVMLLIGIRKNKSSLVLCYFGYSVVVSILGILAALLLLLNSHWIQALLLALGSLFNTHCAAVVHATYDLMLKGVMLKFSQRLQPDEAFLIESTD